MSAQFDEMMAAAVAKTNAEGGRRKAEDNPARAADAYCRACGFKMVGGADVGLCPKCGSPRWFKADDKKATVRIELPALAFRSEPPQPAAWEAMCLAADTMLAVISTYHNLVVSGTVKPGDAERLRVTIALEQLSGCAHQVIRKLEKGGAA